MPSIQEIYAAINKAEERGDERSVEILSNLFERQRRANLGLPPLPTLQKKMVLLRKKRRTKKRGS